MFGQLTGKREVVELGCGVAGLTRLLAPRMSAYLGVDSSFTSVALARGKREPAYVAAPGPA